MNKKKNEIAYVSNNFQGKGCNAPHPALELKTWSASQHLGRRETASKTWEIRGAADAAMLQLLPKPPPRDELPANDEIYDLWRRSSMRAE